MLSYSQEKKRGHWYLMPFAAGQNMPEDALMVAAQCLICTAEIENGLVVITHTGMGDMAEPVSLPSGKIALENGLVTISHPNNPAWTRRIIHRRRLLTGLSRSTHPDILRTAIAIWCQNKTISYVRKYPQLDDQRITLDFLGGGGLSISVVHQGRKSRLKLEAWAYGDTIGDLHVIKI
jgi:hypothetical protein